MNLDLTKPDNLTEAGNQAFYIITAFLEAKGLTYAGCDGSIFYSPEEWAGRGEEYGYDSVLIVTHDGGDHAGVFNWDYQQYDLMEQLRRNLAPYGMYTEQCTCWYSAVYHRPTNEEQVKGYQ